MSETAQVILESSEDIEARQKHVEAADAENRIDGVFRDPCTDAIFNSYVNREIVVTDLVPQLKALLEIK